MSFGWGLIISFFKNNNNNTNKQIIQKNKIYFFFVGHIKIFILLIKYLNKQNNYYCCGTYKWSLFRMGNN